MKILNKIMVMFAVLLVVSSCEDENVLTLSPPQASLLDIEWSCQRNMFYRHIVLQQAYLTLLAWARHFALRSLSRVWGSINSFNPEREQIGQLQIGLGVPDGMLWVHLSHKSLTQPFRGSNNIYENMPVLRIKEIVSIELCAATLAS